MSSILRKAGIAGNYSMLLTLVIGIVLSTAHSNHAEAPTQHSPTALRCGTPYLLQAMDDIGEDQRLKLVQQRPSTQHSLLTPSGHFRVHYDTEGSDAVDPDDDDGNGIPDYIDLAATVLDSTWALEVEQLGYNPPPSDNGLGGGDEYDVYVIDLNGVVYGYTYRGEQSGYTSHSYIEIDNDFTDPGYKQTRGLDALRVTIAHEFHHAIQFGYYAKADGCWWQESTATWMEEVAYPHIDDYLQYLPHFLDEPYLALNSGACGSNHTYGSAIFSHFLDQHYGPALKPLIREELKQHPPNRIALRARSHLNRLIWEEVGRRKSVHLDHFDRVLRQVEPGGLGVAVGEFAVWNYFTNNRHRDQFYAEGDKYPTVPTRDIAVAAEAVSRDTSLIHATGSVYLRLQPHLRPGGVNLFWDADPGAWRRHLLLIGPDSVAVQAVSEPTIQIIDWDRFDEIVLVASSAERTGLAYQHFFTAQFDPSLTDPGQSAPLATLLQPNYPNPFRPGHHRHTRLAFDLAFPSRKTRLALFTANGTLVWEQDLGERRADEHAVLWDGRNAAGHPVASGIYHLLLEADGTAAKRTIAVVRD